MRSARNICNMDPTGVVPAELKAVGTRPAALLFNRVVLVKREGSAVREREWMLVCGLLLPIVPNHYELVCGSHESHGLVVILL